MTPRLIAALCIAATALSGCIIHAPQKRAKDNTIVLAPDVNNCRIGKVIDGDTVRITCNDGSYRSARLVGFDTPETYQPGCAAEKALGLRATAHLRALVANSTLVEVAPGGTGPDKYGRMLLKLYLDGKPVAGDMINAGLAVPYDGGKRIDWCWYL